MLRLRDFNSPLIEGLLARRSRLTICLAAPTVLVSSPPRGGGGSLLMILSSGWRRRPLEPSGHRVCLQICRRDGRASSCMSIMLEDFSSILARVFIGHWPGLPICSAVLTKLVRSPIGGGGCSLDATPPSPIMAPYPLGCRPRSLPHQHTFDARGRESLMLILPSQ